MKVTITLTESVISLTLSSITFLLNSLLKPVSYQNDIWRSLWFSFPDLDFTTISPTIAAFMTGGFQSLQTLSLSLVDICINNRPSWTYLRNHNFLV
ncbi:hypothetical protein NC653_001849 [Populus alba x Populus x berolinensis]|uniref:Uncharacterized protein n=1 Tax=Populus alba x Populus x berolinensis TaxID=444605 RepID=A0AAD6WGI4_9ROSI|nr:hypothetical protein NC653_001849 [Populus alba x Populus x berolinensis]